MLDNENFGLSYYCNVNTLHEFYMRRYIDHNKLGGNLLLAIQNTLQYQVYYYLIT